MRGAARRRKLAKPRKEIPSICEESSWLHRRRCLGIFCSGFRCRTVIKTGRRQDGWSIVRMLALLDFHFREEHGRGNCGDGHLAAFRAANAVEDMLLVAR